MAYSDGEGLQLQFTIEVRSAVIANRNRLATNRLLYVF